MIRITETLRDWATGAGRAATEDEAGRPSQHSFAGRPNKRRPSIAHRCMYVCIYLLSNKQECKTDAHGADVLSSSLARFDASKPQCFDRKGRHWLLGVINYIHVERG